MKLYRQPCQTLLMGIPKPDLEALRDHFSYFVEGAQYSPKYQQRDKEGNRLWDGFVRLIRWSPSDRAYAIPAGLHQDLLDRLEQNHPELMVEEVEDRPPVVEYEELGRLSLKTSDGKTMTPRPVQLEARDAAVKAGTGILRLPVRSGKTFVAALLISALRQRTLFAVPSRALLKQALQVMRERFPHASVTQFGDGVRDASGHIVVATNGTLMKSWQDLDGFGVLIVDECHHVAGTGTAWRDALMGIGARHRFGLSATLDVPEWGSALETKAVWTRALCGPICFSRTTSDMIELGYVKRPLIRMIRHTAPRSDIEWSAKLITDLIVNCDERNRAMVDAAEPYWREGATVLFDTQRIAHARALVAMIQKRLPPGQVALCVGKVKPAQREAIMAAFGKSIRVVVGNLLGEGVDIPHLRIVVNAEGGRGMVSTIQRMRNLNEVEGKGRAIVIDTVDHHHPKLREWTVARKRVYERESLFDIEVERA